jgi:two-component system cell cycle sensor histidine kinase/response regulator CckA
VAMTAAGTGLCYVGLGLAASRWRAAMREADRAAELARTAELSQRRTAERLRALAEASPLPTMAFDADRNVHAWNSAAERLLGWTAAEAIGRSMTSFVPEGMRDRVAARARQSLTTGRQAGARRSSLLRRDGQEIEVEIHEAVERDEAGRPVGLVAQFVDLTDREAVEARLMEAQRLEAVGQLAGGIAHDFNNSLTAIAGFASLIASGQSPDPREDARTILNAAEHAATLTRQLLAFSRRVPLQPQLLDLREFVIGIEPLVRRLIGETIQVRVETDRAPALTDVDPSSLEQAILNLAANARDAMPLGGELTLTVRTVPACLADDAAEPQAHVAVEVRDTGSGMSAEAMRHLFEPFFTTKPPGKGTGLGLPMVHGFVAQSGGHIVVGPPGGQGTTVELHFPQAQGALVKASPPARPAGGEEAILFVEDDPAVASFGLACLRRLGYEVTPALNGSEAVALAASRTEPFDLLLTDVVIPGMSGPELASLLHRRHPGTAILYASGYSAEHVDETIVGPQAPLLEKPYSLEQLAAKVRQALDGRDGRGPAAAEQAGQATAE